MTVEGTSLIVIGASIIASVLTVIATDFFGLRRDKARLRMEFAWQLRRQRWDALYSALHSCPLLTIEPHTMMKAISDLAKWSATEVEPWVGSDRVNELRKKREEIEDWHNTVIHTMARDPSVKPAVPSKMINAFRDQANKELIDALQRMRRKYSQLFENQNF